MGIEAGSCTGSGVGAGVGVGSACPPDLLSEEQELGQVDRSPFGPKRWRSSCSSWCWSLSLRWTCCARLQQLADELMGSFQIAGEWIGDGDHIQYYVDACSSVCAIFSEF